MKRLYDLVVQDHLKEYEQMIFLSGPRQVGKTTIAKALKENNKNFYYFNWDIVSDREKILLGQEEVARIIGINVATTENPIVIFDEIHKYKNWKNYIKGFFDQHKGNCRIVVTGSSRLDAYNRGGDSMMGRYFLYHIFPITVGELVESRSNHKTTVMYPNKLKQEDFDNLINNGGFPEPFLRDSKIFSARWRRLRDRQLLKEDIQSMSNIQEIDQLEVLVKILESQVGQIVNRSMLSKQIRVSVSTISRWLDTLKMFYHCFEIKPWARNVKRTLVKEPKIYLYDWSLVKNMGARYENIVAVHLYKYVMFHNDTGSGEYGLYFVRDKDKKEVDFLVVKNDEPWLLVEVKSSSNVSISKSLYYFSQELNTPHALQVVFDMDYVARDCFKFDKPMIVSAQTFLSQLV